MMNRGLLRKKNLRAAELFSHSRDVIAHKQIHITEDFFLSVAPDLGAWAGAEPFRGCVWLPTTQGLSIWAVYKSKKVF